jgi:hypothetical protein
MMTGPGIRRGLLLLDWRAPYLHIMQFQPAIPTRGTKVPASPEWIKGRTTDDA